MKQKYIIPFLALFAALLSGCVHDYPTLTPDGEEGIDPTLVEVNTEVTLDLELVPLEIVTETARSGSTKAASDYRRRFIVEARREGKTEERQVTVLDEAEPGNDKLTLPINLRLHAVEYTLVVWTDYVEAGAAADLYYNTENTEYIACTEPYTGSTDRRDCLYGTAALDLRPYRDEWNAKVQVQIEMVRPLAKYEIIATDVKEFLEKTGRQRAQGEAYTVTFTYGFYFPLAFNALSGKPADSQMGVTFTTPLDLPTDGSEECTLGTDYIFVNGAESYVPLNIEIKDADGRTVGLTTGLDVPYRRGHLTTVRGPFLTSRFSPGVGIDPGFDDEDINIDLDELK